MNTPTADTKQVLVLLNPRAGQGQADVLQQSLRTIFEQHHWQVTIVQLPEAVQLADVTTMLREHVEQGISLVVAVGGDGTVSLVANAILRAGAAESLSLGIIPGGTANSLARELKLPVDTASAAQLLATSSARVPLDAMLMNDHYYFLRIGIGLDAEVIRETSRESKRWLGRLAYLRTFLGRFFWPRGHRYYCTLDGKKRSFRAVQLFIANGGQIALAPFRIGPDIHSGDGVLNVCAYDVQSWWHYLQVAWRLLRRNYDQQPRVKFWTIQRQMVIGNRNPLPVQGDGEACGQTPVTIQVIPGAIHVIGGVT